MEPEGRFFERFWLPVLLWSPVVLWPLYLVGALVRYPYAFDRAALIQQIAPFFVLWSVALAAAIAATRRARRLR